MENHLLFNKHILIYEDIINLPELILVESTNLKKTFFGAVHKYDQNIKIDPGVIIYLFGNIEKIYAENRDKLSAVDIINVIKELSINYDENSTNYSVINLGQVPINVCNSGIFFKEFISDKNYFSEIENSHAFQELTESTKPNIALRRGIYLTNVLETKNGIEYNLLRCSSNLNGPTDNFRDIDNEIINRTNQTTTKLMSNPAPINHVLAQIYYNSVKTKARISAHSDKSKDMPPNAIIGFFTCYDKLNNKFIKRSKESYFDYCYKETSVLTQLVFKLKDCVVDDNLATEFVVTLYPNSLFLIPLSTNRLYTHEIRPSTLPSNYLPTRLGYVMRCSNTKAIYKDNQVFIIDGENNHIKLQPCNNTSVSNLRNAYFLENTTADIIDYGFVDFSMNTGDYLQPMI